jgi:hypothetical protein
MRRQAQNPGQSNRSVNPEEEEEVRAREARIYVRPNTLFQILSTSEYDDGAMQDFGQRWDRELADYLEDLINVENFAIPRSLALNFMSSLHRVPLNEEIETRPDGSRFRRYSLGWSSFQESYASEALQEILVNGQRLMQSDGRPLLLPETLANLYVLMARSANPNNTTTIMPYRPERLPNETPRVAESRQELDHVAHLRWIRSPNDEELAWMDRRIMGHLFCLSREQGSSCRYFPNPNTGEQIEIQRDVAFMNIRDLYERHGRWAYDITDPDTIRLLRETIERVDRRYGLIPAPPRIESAVPLPGTPPPAPAPRRPLPVPLPPPQTTQQQQQTQAPRREQQQTQPPRRQNSPNARNLESMRGREWSGGNSFRLKCYSANEARTNGIDCALFDRNSSRVQTMTL